MGALAMDGFKAPLGRRDDLPEVRPAANQLLVRVHASSVTPADARIASGRLGFSTFLLIAPTDPRTLATFIEDVGPISQLRMRPVACSAALLSTT
jgi:NADPH:quinone reductase-like Zn-dependent oxidoreductase